MIFIAGFLLGAFAGGTIAGLMVAVVASGKISDLQDRIDLYELRGLEAPR